MISSPAALAQDASVGRARTAQTSSRQGAWNFGQFVSRSFNFVYVLVSCCFLVFAPFSVNEWSIGARALWLFGAIGCDLLVVQGIKHIFYVPRPYATDRFAWGRRFHSGFPSGHTVPAFLLATLIAQAHPFLWFWFAGAALIGWARWRVTAHYAYQVIISALMGTGIGLLAGHYLR